MALTQENRTNFHLNSEDMLSSRANKIRGHIIKMMEKLEILNSKKVIIGSNNQPDAASDDEIAKECFRVQSRLDFYYNELELIYDEMLEEFGEINNNAMSIFRMGFTAIEKTQELVDEILIDISYNGKNIN